MEEGCGREKERDNDGVRDGRRRKMRCRVIPQSILVVLMDEKRKLGFSVLLDLETRQSGASRSNQRFAI
jgi:hypothetical protein